MSNALRVAGDGWRDDVIVEPNLFMPGAVPQDYNERNRYLFYRRDIGIPKHRLNWNWIVDLPFGRGKLLGGNTSGFINGLIGGWQIAGNGQLISRHFQQNQFVSGPIRWLMNASAFKAIPLTETVFLRFNIDFFNVFNTPGTAMPNATTGIITNQFSDIGARLLQLTLRLSW